MTSPLQSQPSQAGADQARRLPEEEQEALGTDKARQSGDVFPAKAATTGPELCEEGRGGGSRKRNHL